MHQLLLKLCVTGVRLEGFAELEEAKIAGLKIPELVLCVCVCVCVCVLCVCGVHCNIALQ